MSMKITGTGQHSRVSQPLSHRSCLLLADTLEDTPRNVISLHLLRRDLCHAYVLGGPMVYRAVVIQDIHLPEEPVAYGDDPEQVWALLKTVPGWTCVNVAEELARPLGRLIHADIGKNVRYYGDVYFTLEQSVVHTRSGEVRLMTEGDLTFLQAVPNEMRPFGFGSLESLLAEGFVAGAVVNEQLVSVAQTYARTQKHAEVGVNTLPAYRGFGYATACAALVAASIQAAGQIPVWSAGETNTASLRVAEKLGFQEVSRRTYVIPEAD